MHYYLNIEDKTGEDLAKEFMNIPIEATSLGIGIDVLRKKESDDLKLFSIVPSHINHISLKNNMICAMNITKLQIFFSSIPPHIKSLDLCNNGIHTLRDEMLIALKGFLGNIDTIYLRVEDYSKILRSTHSKEKAALIGGIFPNAKEVVLLDAYGREYIHNKNEHALRRFDNARFFSIKTEIPSLAYQAAFFVESHPHLRKEKQYLPEGVEQLCTKSGGDRYGSARKKMW